MRTKHLTVIIAASAMLLLVGVVVVVVLALLPEQEEPSANRTNAAANASVQNTNAVNVNGALNANAQAEVTYTGKVFLKGYGTRSESFGIATGEGYEIGLGSYDSRKEEFRPYIGDQVTVIFSSTCKSNTTDCCRSLFETCGTVKSWQPVKQ